MAFEDVLDTFDLIHQVRIFDQKQWSLRQKWAQVQVHWAPQYSHVYFHLHLVKKSDVVFALSQLDHRYFHGLQGRYEFQLELLVRKADSIIVGVSSAFNFSSSLRSVSLDANLEPRSYEILVKVKATEIRDQGNTCDVEDTATQAAAHQSKKLQQVARNYDLAHGKLDDVYPKQKQMQIEGNDTQLNPDSKQAAWNTTCGVGLRVFAQDRDMTLEVRYHGEGDEAVRDGQVYSRSDALPDLETGDLWDDWDDHEDSNGELLSPRGILPQDRVNEGNEVSGVDDSTRKLGAAEDFFTEQDILPEDTAVVEIHG